MIEPATRLAERATRCGFGILAIGLILIISGCNDAPIEQTQTTWHKIQEAELIGAARCVPELADAAEVCYDSAWQVIDRENRLLANRADAGIRSACADNMHLLSDQ